MAGHKTKGSLRSKTPPAPWKADNPMRPGKTAMYQEQHKAKPARK